MIQGTRPLSCNQTRQPVIDHTQEPTSDFSALPPNALSKLFSHFKPLDAVNLAQVCHSWKEIATQSFSLPSLLCNKELFFSALEVLQKLILDFAKGSHEPPYGAVFSGLAQIREEYATVSTITLEMGQHLQERIAILLKQINRKELIDLSEAFRYIRKPSFLNNVFYLALDVKEIDEMKTRPDGIQEDKDSVEYLAGRFCGGEAVLNCITWTDDLVRLTPQICASIMRVGEDAKHHNAVTLMLHLFKTHKEAFLRLKFCHELQTLHSFIQEDAAGRKRLMDQEIQFFRGFPSLRNPHPALWQQHQQTLLGFFQIIGIDELFQYPTELFLRTQHDFLCFLQEAIRQRKIRLAYRLIESHISPNESDTHHWKIALFYAKFGLYRDLEEEICRSQNPKEFPFIDACHYLEELGMLDQAREVAEIGVDCESVATPFFMGTLINHYLNHGDPKKALETFQEIPQAELRYIETKFLAKRIVLGFLQRGEDQEARRVLDMFPSEKKQIIQLCLMRLRDTGQLHDAILARLLPDTRFRNSVLQLFFGYGYEGGNFGRASLYMFFHSDERTRSICLARVLHNVFCENQRLAYSLLSRISIEVLPRNLQKEVQAIQTHFQEHPPV